MKKFFSLILILSLFVFCVAFASAEFEAYPTVIASGSCGEDAEWKLTADGTLYINGSGKIDDCESNSDSNGIVQPWSSHYEFIKSVIIEDGITDIGECAFAACHSLTRVTIPNSVTSIGIFAFAECSNLTAVTIPSSVTSIRGGAFIYCEGLTSVTIPGNVTYIDKYTFKNCRNLTDIKIPSSVTKIGDMAFDECPNLKEINFSGSREQWAAIQVRSGNESLQQATVIFNGASANDIYPKVSAGWVHSLYLGEPCGKVVSTGSNEYRAYNLSNWTDIVDIADGTLHALGLKADGTVVAVGYNDCGQCDVLPLKNIIALDAGKKHSVFLKDDGTVITRGDNTHGQRNIDDWKNIIAVSAGEAHTVGLKADGSVAATGYNVDGECNVESWPDIIAVSAGSNHTVGLKRDGTVIAVGSNKYGQCDVFGWTDIVAVSAGERHTLALRADGTVAACGSNEYGQCDVSAWRDVVSISAGSRHSLGGCRDGGVYAAGSNGNNQLDIATKTAEVTSTQAQTQTVINVTDEDVFSMIEGVEFNFCSGAGAWRTVLKIAGDGSFTGKYYDSDSDIRYECEFSGRFKNAKKVDDYTYSFELDYLNREGPKEEYVDEFGIRIVPSEPYGLETGKNYMLYLPGSAMNTLPEEFVSWISLPNAWYSDKSPTFLSFFGIYNVDGQYGFYEEKG